MAKRTAEHQISKEGGGLEEGSDGEEFDGRAKEMPKAADLGTRKIRALPARKTTSASPAPEAAAPPAVKPAFGSAFSFGSAVPSSVSNTSTTNPSASTALKPPMASSLSFGSSTSPSKPVASASAANPFGLLNLPKPTSSIPISSATSTFSFGSLTPSFSAPTVSSVPPIPSASSVPPPSAAPSTLPWSETGSLPLSGEGKVPSPSASVIVEPPSTPGISASPAPSTKSGFNFSSSSAPAKPSPLSTSSFSFNASLPITSTPMSQPISSASTSTPGNPSALAVPTSTTGQHVSPAIEEAALLLHYRSLRGLNASLITLLQSLTTSDPFIDLSSTLEQLAKNYADKRRDVGTVGPDDETLKMEAAGKGEGVQDDVSTLPKATSAELFKIPSAPVLRAAIPAPVPTTPVFPSSTANLASSGGFSFGGSKVAFGGAAAASTPFPISNFDSSSTGPSASLNPKGGFSFAPPPSSTSVANPFTFPSSTSQADAPKPSFAFSSTTPTSTALPSSADASSSSVKAQQSNKPVSESISFMKSLISQSPPSHESKPIEVAAAAAKPKPFGGSSAPVAKPSSTPSFSFGTSTSPWNPTPPSFQRLPGGTANFSFGAASPSPSSPNGDLRRQVSSPSFSFGAVDSNPSDASSSVAPLSSAPPSTTATTATTEEEPPAPTIPSDPTLLLKGQGEEDETTYFECRGAISKFDDLEGSGKKGWVKVGVGIVKVKVSKDDAEAEETMGRLLARNEGNGGLLMNFALHSDLQPTITQTKCILFAGFEKTKGLQFLLRVKDGATAQGLLNALTERLAKKQKK